MEASISGYCPIGKTASFAVKICDNFGNVHERIVPLKLKSKYQAELAAIEYVMTAIPYKDIKLTIKVPSGQILHIFEVSGHYFSKKKSNDMIKRIRELSSQFTEFECILLEDEEEINSLKEKAKMVYRI